MLFQIAELIMFLSQQNNVLRNFPKLVKRLFNQDLLDPKVFDIMFANRNELRTTYNGVNFVARKIAQYVFELHAYIQNEYDSVLIDGNERFIRLTYNDIKNSTNYIVSVNTEVLPIIFDLQNISTSLKLVLSSLYSALQKQGIGMVLDLAKLLDTVKSKIVFKQMNKISIDANTLPYIFITRGIYNPTHIDNVYLDDLYNTTIIVALVSITELDIPPELFYSNDENAHFEITNRIESLLNVYAVGDYQMLSELALFFVKVRTRL